MSSTDQRDRAPAADAQAIAAVIATGAILGRRGRIVYDLRDDTPITGREADRDRAQMLAETAAGRPLRATEVSHVLARLALRTPELRRIVRTPALVATPRGIEVVTERTWLDDGTLIDPPAVDVVDLATALRTIGQMIAGTPFVGDGDRDIAHALLVQAGGARPLVGDEPTPPYVIDAPVAGAGKTFLAVQAGIVALGRPPSITPISGDNGIARGLTLDETLARQPPILVLDNAVPGSLRSPLMHAITTAIGRTEIRLSAGRGIREVYPPDTIVATGIALSAAMGPELARRAAVIRLGPRVPGRDALRGDVLIAALRSQRPLVLGSLVALMREWIRLGCPQPPRTLDSYQRWSDVIGGIVCATVPGAADRWLVGREVPTSPWVALIEAIAPHPESLTGMAASEILRIASAADVDVESIVGPGTAAGQRQRLGALLTRHATERSPLPGTSVLVVRTWPGNISHYAFFGQSGQ